MQTTIGTTRAPGKLPAGHLAVEMLHAAPQAAPVNAQREESDDYGAVVAVLNPDLRVIRGRCDMQWICQHPNGKRKGAPIWASFAFCATKEGLLLRLPKCGYGCDPAAWAVIEGQPDFYPKGA